MAENGDNNDKIKNEIIINKRDYKCTYIEQMSGDVL